VGSRLGVRNFRAADSEHDRYEFWARRMTVSEWIRRTLADEVDRCDAERRRTEAQVQERKRLRDTAKGYY
jgi:hypothetical protein